VLSLSLHQLLHSRPPCLLDPSLDHPLLSSELFFIPLL
jgi:hypothetical protein